ncbi:MAG: ribonuclease R [Bacteroidetes bacterium]|nr:ribonuclease R [Bacteroidota bacterium]
MGRKNNKRVKQAKQARSLPNVLKGTLEITRSGVGYVRVTGMDMDILIRPGDFNTALHGDLVEVGVKQIRAGGRRMQGTIRRVIKRRRTEFIGELEGGKRGLFLIPEYDKPIPDLFIPSSKQNGAVAGDRVLVRLIEWEKEAGGRPTGEVITLLTHEEPQEIAMKNILLDAGFPLEFTDEALEEAARIPETIEEEEVLRRRDFRKIFTITIDPVNARDFDDALSLQFLEGNWIEVGVHIADVSHYLIAGGVLDDDAYERATSVYLPDRVLPMLPEHISNVLCSLRPKEDKLTFSAVFEMHRETGQIRKTWLGKTLIHSDHRFTYEEVQQILETREGIYVDQLLSLNQVARQLRAQRFANGAINFSSQEVRFQLDEKGTPLGITIKESKEAHQLIEEYMLLANRAVAEYLGKVRIQENPLPFPYRTHDDPDRDKLLPFVAFAKKFGHGFDLSSPESITDSFNQLLQDVQGRPEQHVLEQLGIRTMAKAKYTIENIGHYGLGFEHYCHFTSPIRRYPDVLVHRQLFEVLKGKPQLDNKMADKCLHCSERERGAMEAERSSNKYLQVRYMQQFLGQEFDGVISGVASFGFWVETVDHKCEGLVSAQSLYAIDDFRHVESDYCLLGTRSGLRFSMGDKVRITVIAANLAKRQLDYEWVSPLSAAPKKTKARKPKSPKG